MNERDWKEEQRDVLTRLFKAVFERRQSTEEEISLTLIFLARSRGGYSRSRLEGRTRAAIELSMRL